MSKQIISFIGGGNMATSLIGGILGTGYDRSLLWVSEPDADRRKVLEDNFGIRTTGDNAEAAEKADTVVFAVKPQFMGQVVRALAGSISAHRPLAVSVAAGVREPDIRRWLGFDAAIVRAMPNTPALVSSGATALFANPWVSQAQRGRSESLLRAVGITLWVENESDMDTVTALSGSGPAYFFLVMEAMEAIGRELGLDQEAAHLLTLETALGAARMALESPEQLHTLRARVTSPGGTTERALAVLEEGGIMGLFGDALRAARDRSVALGRELGGDNG
uniref:Pyrroline-5-carboxylate reductase n=1 Tax=Candidatus Kentrum sp. FM TaxID=2126340 RepID=A0A450W6I4_9GAMM|nr:MAG: pyrroline-5-carboxylate reductase [Candidatus Kentron sp. FM]VFJ67119.1 MAG: pyrroline-5-carboxylate reductase [Candidatus Kentron sp. FM]VFK12672.1 MAG: pyrroline-5-carboxylate reductase [Candidatus Kentron sp. FM]